MKNAALGCPSSVFSWQITPVETLIIYLRQQFIGMMERKHLVPSGRTVVNAIYGTEHHHEFRMDSDDDAITEQFSAARRKHDAMCFRTKTMISDDEPTLFVVSNSLASSDQSAEIEALLRHYNRDKKIALLFVETPHVTADWRGDDESWDSAFADIAFSNDLTAYERFYSIYLRTKGQFLRFGDHLKSGRF